MKHADNSSGRPPVIGIVGGLAAGKSTVARLLGKRGAVVIDADRLGHGALELPGVKDKLIEEFGAGIVDEEGQIDRANLAEEAFRDPDQADKLNSIVHPPVIRQIVAEIEAATRRGEAPLIALDAALLVEADLHREQCDALLYVDAPRRLRKRRAMERGMSEEQFARRTAVQASPERKKQLSDFTVENTGTIEELDARVGQLWPELCSVESRISPPSHSF
ncbi:MAG: dephospho-CoA kinase [Candidatus Brocadiia bacterium]